MNKTMSGFKTQEAEYLHRILENTFENANSECLRNSDCRAELSDAVLGIDSLLHEQGTKIDALEKSQNKTTNENEFLPPYAHADAPETQEREEFRIDSENAANWYLRKLANIESEKQRVQSQAALIVAQLDSDADSLRYVYEGELQEYVRRHLAANGNRRRSLTLLQGNCAFRTCPPSLKISDPAAALDFCRRNLPDCVKTAETLDTTKYREFAEKMQKAGAETLPVGIETVPQKENFSIKF